MDKSPDRTRRALIALIATLAIVQAAILGYLWSLNRPSGSQDAGQPASLPQILSPATSAASQAGTDQTLVPDTAEVSVGPLIPAADYVALARMFDEEQAVEHIAYLASDELGGRQPGTSESRAAGDYIAARFAEYGLDAAGVDGTYFQPFTVPYGRITTLPVLTVTSPERESPARSYSYRIDYRALVGGYLGAGEGEGPVVWLNQCLHADYTGLDMEGKIALCYYTGEPELYRQAVEHQVGGLLLLDREKAPEEPFRRGGYRDTAWIPETIPAYLVSEIVAKDLLAGTGYTLDDLSLLFDPTPLSATVAMAVTTEELDRVEARNVLALLPGSDPEYSDEVVVIGAHYDHLGREPDGPIMNGANDNASGVATILEIARLWQAQGFRPARSILFAAWDAEEIGLLGAQYYVENPVVPLARTVAMLNLDMVSAGEELQIDGEGPVAAQLQASAEAYAITHTLRFEGRSDHLPFYGAGVPAAMLIYWPDPFYHTPDDKLRVIEPQKLKTTGVLASHVLASLAEGYVELELAVERLRASISTGDRNAFLENVDPTDQDLLASQAAWFDSLWSKGLSSLTMEPTQMRIGDGDANVALQLRYRWADRTQAPPSVSYDVRFVQQQGVWVFAGYGLDALAGDVVTVASFSDVPVTTSELLTSTQPAYLALAADLGQEPFTGTRVIYYADAATIQAVARPTADRDTAWLVSSTGLAEIAWGEPITPALVNLILNQMGLPPGEETWLREGLALHYDADPDREYLPALESDSALTSVLDSAALGNLAGQEARTLRAHAWNAAEYLLAQHGTEGLRALCAAWSRSGDSRSAFLEALAVSPEQFESAWRRDWLSPLRADTAAIQSTLAARAEAVLEGNGAAFLSSVTLVDPILRAEEQHWFTELAGHTVTTYTVTGELVGWSSGRNEATVALSVNSVLTDHPSIQTSYDARFVREGSRWLYAGAAWDEMASEHLILKYQSRSEAWAQRILGLAEAAYDQVGADLGLDPTSPIEIKIYDDQTTLQALISPTTPEEITSWTAQNESIKLWLQSADEQSIQSAIAREFARQVLYAHDLEIGWLREGVAAFETDRLRPLGIHWEAARYAPTVQDAVRSGSELSIDDLSFFESLPDRQVRLAQAQSWSLVAYIVDTHGLPSLQELIAQSIAYADTDPSLRAALGMDTEPFLAEWQKYARDAGVPDNLVLMAQRFDRDRALAHVSVLASPELGGREAGAPGADLAAAYIAEQFAELGLEPLGDPLTATVALTETDTVTSELGYLQQFPVPYSHVTAVPTLALLDQGGTIVHEFGYREDFMESAGEGIVLGELVWVHTDDLEGLGFGQSVILEQDVDDPAALATRLQAHGAGGLIVANGRESRYFQTGHARPITGTDITIPVFEITDVAFDTLLEKTGLSQHDLSFAPPVLPLGVQMRQALLRSPLTTSLTSNVIGLLPGSDPDLADEVIVVGAHYDHVGETPDGLYFPGANLNASGVAALLEMARVWQSAGFQPGRSVLLVAWGAEELDSAGGSHYLAHPAVPLTRTVGVIALDSIGNGRGFRLLYYGTQENDLALAYRIEAGTAELNRRAQRKFATGEGWHALFSEVGIATTKLIWDGTDRDAYQTIDTLDYIDPERLAFSGEILILTTSWLARQ